MVKDSISNLMFACFLLTFLPFFFPRVSIERYERLDETSKEKRSRERAPSRYLPPLASLIEKLPLGDH